jgi:hypothetical protein
MLELQLAKPNSGYRYLPPARKSLSPAKEADDLRVSVFIDSLFLRIFFVALHLKLPLKRISPNNNQSEVTPKIATKQ